MSQRYYQPLRPRPDAPSSSYNQPSHERLAPTSLPFPASSSSGLGLSFYTASMAMTQTQSSRPVHGLSYFQRPMWDPTSTLMLNASSDSADMDRGKSWEEAYDPFAQFHTTDPPTHDQPLLLTPVSRSAGYQRLSETPNPIPSHGFPHSQAGSYSSVSYPSSEAYHLERSTSLFSHSSVKVEDPLDWTSNPHNELQVPRTSMENEFFVTPESVYDSHRFVQSPAPTELHALSHVAPKLGKHHRDDSLAERGSPRLSVQRLKQAQSKRRRTPRENANWVCEICDMPFERSYNLKSHMDTHDPDRQKPFKCEYEGCYREFVRKTDLMRHISSVHVKAKDWVCSLCDQAFARKDTLRRHEEDGCAKRFEMKHRDHRQSSISRSSTHSSPLPQERSLTEEAAMQLSQLAAAPATVRSPQRGKRR